MDEPFTVSDGDLDDPIGPNHRDLSGQQSQDLVLLPPPTSDLNDDDDDKLLLVPPPPSDKDFDLTQGREDPNAGGTPTVKIDIRAPPDLDLRLDGSGDVYAESDSRNVGIVIGILLTVILVLAGGIFYVVYRNKKGVGSKSTPTHSLITRKFTDRFSNSIDYKVSQKYTIKYEKDRDQYSFSFFRTIVSTPHTAQLPRCRSTVTCPSRTTSPPLAKLLHPHAIRKLRKLSMKSRSTTDRIREQKCIPRLEVFSVSTASIRATPFSPRTVRTNTPSRPALQAKRDSAPTLSARTSMPKRAVLRIINSSITSTLTQVGRSRWSCSPSRSHTTPDLLVPKELLPAALVATR